MSRLRSRLGVRTRLTLLYAGLFLAFGAGLLTITYLLFRQATDDPIVVSTKTHTAGGAPPRASLTDLGAQAARDRRRDQAAADRRHANELSDLLLQSGIALGTMGVAALGLGWLVAGRVLRPLHDGLEAQRRFVANASHELRTPLAMMRTSLDVAAAKPGPQPPELRALDGKLREGLDQGERLLESFLTLARAQHGALADRAALALDDLAAGAIAERRQAIADHGIELRDTLGRARVRGSQTLLARMVANLLDNAIRHNQPGGWVRLETRLAGDVAQLVVENGGARLSDGVARELAQPFRRVAGERTVSANGVGVGLSIVAAIVRAHDGDLRVRARDDGGLAVTVALPGAPA